MNKYHYGLILVLLSAGLSIAADESSISRSVSEYDCVFSTPSKDEADSVPLGNGTTGINLWAEEDGDLIFYLSRNDSISEMHRLLKLGRIRISFSNKPFAKDNPFRQVLRLADGVCEIKAGKPGDETRVRVFVDSDSQVVYIEGESDREITVSAVLENWRSEPKVFDSLEIGSSWIFRGGIPNGVDYKNEEAADVVLNEHSSITWYHRNERSPVPLHIERQRLTPFADRVPDPILHRTFGASIFGEGFARAKENTLRQIRPSRSFDLRIATHSEQTPDADTFLNQLRMIARRSVPATEAAKRTRNWWRGFWNRSWIFVREGKPSLLPLNDLAFHIGAGRAGQFAIGGEFGRCSVFSRALSEDEIGKLAASAPQSESPLDGGGIDLLAREGADLARGSFNQGYLAASASEDWSFPYGFTMEAWIKPAGPGRLFDKITPGGTDGMLLDVYGGRLRLIVGNQTFLAEPAFPMDEWTHVAVVGKLGNHFDIYQNGQRVGGSEGDVPEGMVPSKVTQAYILTRYQFACQQRSIFPSHFNGGIFVVAPEFAYYGKDPRGKGYGADYRFYGPNFWWQNTRFMYQLHLAQGNFDLMDSFYEFYFRNIPVFEAMAKTYYNADGIYMNEVLSHFGLPGMADFGWNTKEYNEGYTRNIWQQALEFGAMALDRYDYTGDRQFLKKTVEWCDKALSFYDTRFEKGPDGKIIIHPTHGLETYWHGVTGDMPSIAGLQEVSARLLALPPETTTREQRRRWKRIAAAVPELPKRENDDELIVPYVAQEYDPRRANFEAPDLYCVYPFRLYGIGRTKHDIEEARRAWHAMPNKGRSCWYQVGIFAARLGMTEQAKEDILIRADNRLRVAGEKRLFRFPGFYGSPHDYPPDYDGAGNMANTLQEMLIQPGPEDKILILPAWPREWDVDFKLHAPKNTVVEGRYADGELKELKVTPENRAKDVKILSGKTQ